MELVEALHLRKLTEDVQQRRIVKHEKSGSLGSINALMSTLGVLESKSMGSMRPSMEQPQRKQAPPKTEATKAEKLEKHKQETRPKSLRKKERPFARHNKAQKVAFTIEKKTMLPTVSAKVLPSVSESSSRLGVFHEKGISFSNKYSNIMKRDRVAE